MDTAEIELDLAATPSSIEKLQVVRCQAGHMGSLYLCLSTIAWMNNTAIPTMRGVEWVLRKNPIQNNTLSSNRLHSFPS